MNKIYVWYGSRPLETDLQLYSNDTFFRPRGKLIWGCPEGIENNWYDITHKISLSSDDPLLEEMEKRFLYSVRFMITDYSKILTISRNQNLNPKYIKGIKPFQQDSITTQSYIINFDKIKHDGFCGIEVDFESFGGIPQAYYPWSVSSIAIWDSSVIDIIPNDK